MRVSRLAFALSLTLALAGCLSGSSKYVAPVSPFVDSPLILSVYYENGTTDSPHVDFVMTRGSIGYVVDRCIYVAPTFRVQAWSTMAYTQDVFTPSVSDHVSYLGIGSIDFDGLSVVPSSIQAQPLPSSPTQTQTYTPFGAPAFPNPGVPPNARNNVSVTYDGKSLQNPASLSAAYEFAPRNRQTLFDHRYALFSGVAFDSEPFRTKFSIEAVYVRPAGGATKAGTACRKPPGH
jgi:hypothetical protein